MNIDLMMDFYIYCILIFFFNMKFTRFASRSNSGNQCFVHFLLISYR